MIGDIFTYKKKTKLKEYIIVKSELQNGTCTGCEFINSTHCEKSNAQCSKRTGEDINTIIKLNIK